MTMASYNTTINIIIKSTNQHTNFIYIIYENEEKLRPKHVNDL